MLSRSSFSIRRLVSQRRPQGDDDLDEQISTFEYDEDNKSGEDKKQPPKKDPRLEERTLTRNQTTLRTKRGRKEPVVIQRTASIHRISGPLPSPPELKARSNSSLGSYAEISPRHLFGPDGDSGYHLHANTGLKSPRRTHAVSVGTSPAASPRLAPEQARARSLTPERPPRPSRDTIGDDCLLDITANVQQLIRETDLAFQKVGSTLAETRLASDSFAVDLTADVAAPPPQLHQHYSQRPPKPLRLRAVLQRQQHEQKQQITPLPTKVAVSTLASPARRASVAKPKRKKSKKGRRPTADPVAARSIAKATGARWTLSENVVERLGLRRIEADEMITADQIAQFRASREQIAAEAERNSAELARSASGMGGFVPEMAEEDEVDDDDADEDADEGSETPVEPFHLQDLPLRVHAAGVKTAMSPIAVQAPPASFEQVIRMDFSMPRKKPRPAPLPLKQPTPLRHQLAGKNGAAADDNPMSFNLLNFPSPPLRNPLRLMCRAQMQQQLPTIPELFVTAPPQQPDENHHQRGGAAARVPEMMERKKGAFSSFAPVYGEGFVFLRSSPYTLNVPTFRHGPIRLPKGARELALGRDDTLDWTAFQMAILGGAGGFLDDNDNELFSSGPKRHGGEFSDEMDDIVRWFDDFGFESPGLLVPEDFADAADGQHSKSRASSATSSSSPRSSAGSSDGLLSRTSTAESSPVSWDDAASLPIPVETEHPSGFWNEGDCDATRFYASPGIRRWTVEGHPKRYGSTSGGTAPMAAAAAAGEGDNSARTSVESLPLSPMLDLVVSRGVNGEVDVVPMGYNLGHDLGDFLRWEAEHSFSTAV